MSVTLARTRTGTGPPLVLLGGALTDRHLWQATTPFLADHATVWAIDRRGRNETPVGDADDPEVDDILAVIAEAGPGTTLVGHSAAAFLALRVAARRPRDLRRVIAYEPPQHRIPAIRAAGLPTTVPALLAEGRDLDAIAEFLRHGVGLADDFIALMRRARFWGRAALAPSLPFDVAHVARGLSDDEVAAASVPVTFLLGGASPPDMAEGVRELAGRYGAPVRLLADEQHDAMTSSPALFAAAVLDVLRT